MVIEIKENEFIRGIKETPIGEAVWDFIARVAPFRTFLKIYSALIMCIDAVFCYVFCLVSIFQSLLNSILPPAMKSVRDEVTVIVGAGRGIGREIALTLGSLGASVVCVDKNMQSAEQTKKAIQTQGGRAFAYKLDVTNRELVKQTISFITDQVGQIGMLFHCCSIPSPRALTAAATPISSIIDVGVTSHFWLLEEILPRMKKNRHGHIVLLSSVAGMSGIKQKLALGMSQFAVQGIFESLEEDIRIHKLERDIKVSICHIYPFIVSDDLANDIRLRIPSYFGRIDAHRAANEIIDGVRRNMMEISIPKYLIYLSKLMRLLPRKAIGMIRNFFDTGVDFG